MFLWSIFKENKHYHTEILQILPLSWIQINHTIYDKLEILRACLKPKVKWQLEYFDEDGFAILHIEKNNFDSPSKTTQKMSIENFSLETHRRIHIKHVTDLE